MGYFVAYDQRAFQFTISGSGKMELLPKDDRGKLVGFMKALRLQAVVEETMPDGKVIGRTLDEESLTTADKETDKPQAVKFAGKVTGDIAIEVRVAFDGKLIRIGGRVTDPGKSKNPLRLVIRSTITDPYKGSDLSDKNFKRKVEDDEVRVERVDGKNDKLAVDEPVEAGSEEINGKQGLRAVRFEMQAYPDRRIEFTADEGSSLALWNRQKQPLLDGFSINWRHDPAKDAAGKTGFTIEVR